MFIAIVDFHVAPQDRDKALRILAADKAAVALLPGNRSFRPFMDAGSATHVGILQEWDDAKAFANYAGSLEFAAIGAQIRPMMTAPPVSRRMTAELFDEVNG